MRAAAQSTTCAAGINSSCQPWMIEVGTAAASSGGARPMPIGGAIRNSARVGTCNETRPEIHAPRLEPASTNGPRVAAAVANVAQMEATVAESRANLNRLRHVADFEQAPALGVDHGQGHAMPALDPIAAPDFHAHRCQCRHAAFPPLLHAATTTTGRALAIPERTN